MLDLWRSIDLWRLHKVEVSAVEDLLFNLNWRQRERLDGLPKSDGSAGSDVAGWVEVGAGSSVAVGGGSSVAVGEGSSVATGVEVCVTAGVEGCVGVGELGCVGVGEVGCAGVGPADYVLNIVQAFKLHMNHDRSFLAH